MQQDLSQAPGTQHLTQILWTVQERAASGDDGPSRKQGKLKRKRKREAAAAAAATAAVPPDGAGSPVLAEEAPAAGVRLHSKLAGPLDTRPGT